MLIDGRQKRRIKVVEAIITLLGWIYILGFFIYTALTLILWYFNLNYIYNELFYMQNIFDTLKIISVTITAAMVAFVIMLGWGRYNYQKFGHLDRRQFPKKVSSEDIAKYFNLSIQQVDELQSDKWINLEKTIV
ncbi:MAG: pgaD [Anaerosolibacter sp.]|jgi:poly-beta-1,6-N-acetyl-D-glucosamine biosynthesis protein PgaD|uniref:poly-beta-1,6-N-acetyl-D-glucosamine biosynthesis protein PgaD n=1 Tax=Anaerosolibacter sp. TaxID=1872527 RepID=UPI0026049043|nr:poly-beta-1,6-N-acetyl-D-glucosamine biosynthesis protein PgaD [Anaerosolibacter sp.]MDF2547169.1 pgaD [Anaerosolibacter sp.]